MSDKLADLVATWFGCGYVPKGPGTAGSVGAVLPAAILAFAARWPPWSFAILAAGLFAPAVWAAGDVARRKALEDPQVVVVDEVVGQWIALAGATTLNWKSLTAGFVLFRLFDIWKPWPVSRLEDLHGGLGIVADDAMAGFYAAVVLFIAGCFNLY
jgi:phosphatidylglycerophosphatase A